VFEFSYAPSNGLVLRFGWRKEGVEIFTPEPGKGRLESSFSRGCYFAGRVPFLEHEILIAWSEIFTALYCKFSLLYAQLSESHTIFDPT
jgi:hypothetical protein